MRHFRLTFVAAPANEGRFGPVTVDKAIAVDGDNRTATCAILRSAVEAVAALNRYGNAPPPALYPRGFAYAGAVEVLPNGMEVPC